MNTKEEEQEHFLLNSTGVEHLIIYYNLHNQLFINAEAISVYFYLLNQFLR